MAKTKLNKRDQCLVREMRRLGIKHPIWTLRASRRTLVPLSLACAVLTQESGGGLNVFGNDPVKFPQIRGGRVTRLRYAYYKRLRKRGFGMQGVGPMQLTWYEYQDDADRRGGCWKPEANIYTGMLLLATLLSTLDTVRDAVAAYNGSGPHDRYANEVISRTKFYHSRFDTCPRATAK